MLTGRAPPLVAVGCRAGLLARWLQERLQLVEALWGGDGQGEHVASGSSRATPEGMDVWLWGGAECTSLSMKPRASERAAAQLRFCMPARGAAGGQQEKAGCKLVASSNKRSERGRIVCPSLVKGVSMGALSGRGDDWGGR